MRVLKWGLLAVAIIYVGSAWGKVLNGPLEIWLSGAELQRDVLFYGTLTGIERPAAVPILEHVLLAWATALVQVSLFVAVVLGLPVALSILGLIGFHVAVIATLGLYFVDMILVLSLFAAWDVGYRALVADADESHECRDRHVPNDGAYDESRDRRPEVDPRKPASPHHSEGSRTQTRWNREEKGEPERTGWLVASEQKHARRNAGARDSGQDRNPLDSPDQHRVQEGWPFASLHRDRFCGALEQTREYQQNADHSDEDTTGHLSSQIDRKDVKWDANDAGHQTRNENVGGDRVLAGVRQPRLPVWETLEDGHDVVPIVGGRGDRRPHLEEQRELDRYLGIDLQYRKHHRQIALA